MARKTLAPVALLLAFAGLGAAPVPEKAVPGKPDALAPVLASAEVGKDGALAVERLVHRFETVPVQEEVVVGGKKEVRTAYVTQQRLQIITEKYELKDVKAFDTEGKPIETAKLAELFQKSTPVLVSLDGKKVDPYYLQLFKEGTVTLVLPSPKVQEKAPPEKK
jgi:hypothetical protein